MEYKFKILKLHCAACALALEENINTIEGVSAQINFVTKVLKLKINTDNPAETLTKVKIAIKKFDSMAELANYEDEEDLIKKEKRERNIKLSRFLISAIFLTALTTLAGSFLSSFVMAK